MIIVSPTDSLVITEQALSSADLPVDGALSSAEPLTCPLYSDSDSVAVMATLEEDDVDFPSTELVAGRLKNSKIMSLLTLYLVFNGNNCIFHFS